MNSTVTTVERQVSVHLEALTQAVDKTLTDIAGERQGFCLIVFSANEGGRANYASNCARDEVVPALKELLRQWEAGMPDIPAHEFQS